MSRSVRRCSYSNLVLTSPLTSLRFKQLWRSRWSILHRATLISRILSPYLPKIKISFCKDRLASLPTSITLSFSSYFFPLGIFFSLSSISSPLLYLCHLVSFSSIPVIVSSPYSPHHPQPRFTPNSTKYHPFSSLSFVSNYRLAPVVWGQNTGSREPSETRMLARRSQLRIPDWKPEKTRELIPKLVENEASHLWDDLAKIAQWLDESTKSIVK